jgi:hypothetical protein
MGSNNARWSIAAGTDPPRRFDLYFSDIDLRVVAAAVPAQRDSLSLLSSRKKAAETRRPV